MNLSKLSNGDLYREWTESLESAASGDGYAKKREAQCLDEIVRRMQEASRKPLVRQEA
jgi:hypothetical protein